MKVVYFMNHVDHGGAALALLDLIVELNNKYDINTIVVTSKYNRLNKRLTAMGIENYYSRYYNFLSSYTRPEKLWRILLSLRHCFFNKLALFDLQKKINFKEIDIIHSNLDRIDIGAVIAQKNNIPHLWHIREHLDTDFNVLSIKKDYVKYMNSFNSYHVVISDSVRNAWEKRGLDSHRTKTIYDGIFTNNIKVSNQKTSSDRIKLIFLGGYTESKGQKSF